MTIKDQAEIVKRLEEMQVKMDDLMDTGKLTARVQKQLEDIHSLCMDTVDTMEAIDTDLAQVQHELEEAIGERDEALDNQAEDFTDLSDAIANYIERPDQQHRDALLREHGSHINSATTQAFLF